MCKVIVKVKSVQKIKVEMDGRMDMIDCTAFPTKMVSNEKRAGGVIDYL